MRPTGRHRWGPLRIGTLELPCNIILAPMAGVTNLPFRLMARMFGCALAFTEMVSANGLVRGTSRTLSYLETTDADEPLGVQIFGADPEIMAEAARVVTAAGARLLDVNMGCPVKKVVRTGAGAALLRDLESIAKVLQAVRRATHLPLTVKIRAGWSRREIVALEVGKIAQDCGVDALIIHPRTAEQGFRGRADWEIIRQVKQQLIIPVIGNGDVRSPGDVQRILSETGCDGVMIGRAALGNPWIFKHILESGDVGSGCPSVAMEERLQVMMYHLELENLYGGHRAVVPAFRKHLLWYMKGLPGGAKLRERLSRIADERNLWDTLRELVRGCGSVN
ncbi:MAG: tRNA dihydrouridine synthase DusB [Syntrophales bacterium]|nr:tRNA dihydrouridine synthase DusB [Syntrophales bacterium]